MPIICDDNVYALSLMPDGCIDLTVTSPPYDDLRTYGGDEWNFTALVPQLYRVTKQGGVVVWVVGDQTRNGSETGSSFRQAIAFIDAGFNLHDTMIYAKQNPIPQNHNRYEQIFEYMFVFSKGKPKTFNPIRIGTKNAGTAFDWGGRTFLDDKACRRNKGGRGEDIHVVGDTKIKGNIWYYTVGGGKTGHPAVFPDALALDHILSWSNKGDTVLDPFCGSGTTCAMAKAVNREYIGIDINPDYCIMAERRCGGYIELPKEEITQDEDWTLF